jgi:hypothetical protein
MAFAPGNVGATRASHLCGRVWILSRPECVQLGRVVGLSGFGGGVLAARISRTRHQPELPGRPGCLAVVGRREGGSAAI